MAIDYLQPDKEVNRRVKHMREKYYSKYKKARIVTLMRTGKWDKWGTIAKVSKKQYACGVHGDYVLTLNADAWTNMSDKEKQALVDHELRHMKIKTTKTGKKFVLRRHDVEEFIVIAKRYGSWTPNLKLLKEVLAR